MNVIIQMILFSYPFGLFGVGPACGSDAGMMLEKGVFALEYNPSGLAWVDSIEAGVAAEGLFAYNLVGFSYNYRGWPAAVSVHHNTQTTGFSIGAGNLRLPLALGAAFGASFESANSESNYSLRAGLQWREYVGLALGPRLWLAPDTAHLSGMIQIGASVPVVEGLKFLAGASAEVAPVAFRAGGGLAYDPFLFLRVESVVATDGWGAGVVLKSENDRGGVWVNKGFSSEPWRFGISYIRDVQSPKVKEVVVFRNLPQRVDTVYISKTTPVVKDTSKVVSPDVRRRQEQLMAKANRYYAEERYEEALAVWKEVVQLDPGSDLGVRASEDIKDVTALIETLNKIRTGKPQ